MLFTGTLTLGCKSYLDSQARCCYCPPAKDKAYEKSDKGYDKAYEKSDKGYDKAYERSDKYPDKGNKEKDKGKDYKNSGKYGWKQDL